MQGCIALIEIKELYCTAKQEEGKLQSKFITRWLPSWIWAFQVSGPPQLLCVSFTIVYYTCQDHVLESLKMAFCVVILDSKYPKMTPKFVKQKSHWLHSSIKFANPACSPTCKQNPQPCTCLETQNNLGKLNYKPEWTAILFNHPSIWTANIWWAMTLWCITRHFSGLRLGPDVPLCDSKNI